MIPLAHAMTLLSEWLRLLTDVQLPLRDREVIERELQIFADAVAEHDEAVISASVEVLTSVLAGHSTQALQVEVLKAFVEATQATTRRAFGWLNLGTTYSDLAQYSEAALAFERSMATFRELQHSEGIASVELGQGNLHRALGEYPEARAFYQRSTAGTKSEAKKLRILENWIGAELDEGRIGPARSLCEEWFGLAEGDDFKSPRLPNVLHDYGLVGRRFLLSGDPDAARSIAARCTAVAGRASLDPQVVCAELFDELRGRE